MNMSVPPPGRFPRFHGRTPSDSAALPPLPPGLDARSAAVLREIVEQYVATGEPVGSRTLARRLPMSLSPATIRNVMADLTDSGLLFAPHTSAGPSAHGSGSAPVRRWAAEFWRVDRRRTGIDFRRACRCRPQPGGHAGRGQFAAVRPVGRRRAGAGAEVGRGGQAYRICSARSRTGAGGAGEQRRPGGKPGDRDTAGAAAVRAAAGKQLPECPAVGAPAGRTAARSGRGNGGQPHRIGRPVHIWWSPPAWQPGRARAAPAA